MSSIRNAKAHQKAVVYNQGNLNEIVSCRFLV